MQDNISGVESCKQYAFGMRLFEYSLTKGGCSSKNFNRIFYAFRSIIVMDQCIISCIGAGFLYVILRSSIRCYSPGKSVTDEW